MWSFSLKCFSNTVSPLPEDVSKHIECDFSFIRLIKGSFSCVLWMFPQGGWLWWWLRWNPPTYFTFPSLRKSFVILQRNYFSLYRRCWRTLGNNNSSIWCLQACVCHSEIGQSQGLLLGKSDNNLDFSSPLSSFTSKIKDDCPKLAVSWEF